jgi:polyhydroxyalkanoate synthase subunit PhaC
MNTALLDLMFDSQRSAWSETFRAWERMINTAKVPQIAANVRIAQSPHDVVYEEDSLQLLRFRNDSIDLAEPILICYALVNRPYILDLEAERSVVRQLLKRGFDVFLIDWGMPTAADRSLALRDYICRFMANVAGFVREISGSEQLNLLGYCMGGTMSAIYTALYPEQVRNLILMAAPIDFGGDEGLLNLWAREEYFDVDGLIDAFGNCPGSFLQSSFGLRNPVQNFLLKYQTLYEKLDDTAFLESFFAMEHWANDNIPVAGETFREFVKCFYQRNELVKGEYRLNGQKVSLEAIACPLLLLVASRDDLVPPSSTLAIRQRVRSLDVKSLSIDAGHIGLAVGSQAHRQLWPSAAMWIADRSTVRST